MQLRKLMENRGFHRIPLKKLQPGHYYFTARLNGTEGNFILDTGASSSCVGLRESVLFSIKSEESDLKAAGAGATNMTTRFSRKNTLKINSREIRNFDLVVFDLSHVNEALAQTDEDFIHGIIGADFLKNHRAVIDYGRNCLYIK